MNIPIQDKDELISEDKPDQRSGSQSDDAASIPVAERELSEEEERAFVEAAKRRGVEAAEREIAEAQERAAEQARATAAELEDALQKAEDANDRLLRLQADWANYRQRTAAERLAERAYAAEKFVTNLLPVVDDLERALEHADQIDHAEAGAAFEQFVDGMKAVHTKLMAVLEKEGVRQLDPTGEPFDPLSQQAVGRVEDSEAFEETVAAVYQKGYQLGDKTIRAAMVTVTFGGPVRPAAETADEAAAGGVANAAGKEGNAEVTAASSAHTDTSDTTDTDGVVAPKGADADQSTTESDAAERPVDSQKSEQAE